jgi:hypothetical protein
MRKAAPQPEIDPVTGFAITPENIGVIAAWHAIWAQRDLVLRYFPTSPAARWIRRRMRK